MSSPEWHDTPERKTQFYIVQTLLAGGPRPRTTRSSDKEMDSLVNTYIWAQWARKLVPHLQNLGYTKYPDFRDVRRAYPYTLSTYFRRGEDSDLRLGRGELGRKK